MAEIDRRFVSRAVLVAMLTAVVALSACGRKGPLEAPPGLAVKADSAATTTDDKTDEKPDKAFVLDPLLK